MKRQKVIRLAAQVKSENKTEIVSIIMNDQKEILLRMFEQRLQQQMGRESTEHARNASSVVVSGRDFQQQCLEESQNSSSSSNRLDLFESSSQAENQILV